ncbi:MAG: isoprenylcysteine carboxylmethyltransferase family protein [Gemmatimonadaceae bacterium]|nr:isoprenylcysteine carboxylmethyltransferase family protein [Gemmatimonadaceae bacterium]
MSWLEFRIPPLLIALAAAAAMWLLARSYPEWAMPFEMRGAVATAVAVIGVMAVVAGAIQFRRARTTITPLNPAAASALVVSGIYRFTRNPMYLGVAIVLLAWAVYLSHPLALLGVVAFAAYIHRFQIIPEEKTLRALFPGAYEAYARQVRRWL